MKMDAVGDRGMRPVLARGDEWRARVRFIPTLKDRGIRDRLWIWGRSMLKKLPFRDIVRPPLADPRQRQLKVDGLLERPAAFGIRDIRAVEPVVATLPVICVEWRDTRVRWKGMPPGEIMRRIRPRPGAKCPTVYSRSEHIDSLSLEDAMNERTLLACKSIKWVTRISSVDSEEPGYRETRGYSPGLAYRTKRERSMIFGGSDGP